MSIPDLRNSLRRHRILRHWSQAELARRTGLSRPAISAIETGRLVPSTAAALALAGALDLRVEEIFCLAERKSALGEEWAWKPAEDSEARFWHATVRGRHFRYPVEQTLVGTLPTDGIARQEGIERFATADPSRTIVLAGCDPAVGVLAEHLRAMGFRLLPLNRSSGAALELLGAGAVHLAGVHLGDNAREVKSRLGSGYELLRLATWDEGLSLAPGLGLTSVRAVVRANVRWVVREEGSGARKCLDRILRGRPRPRGYRRQAASHMAVAETIRTGWAQAGICIRLAAAQAGLDFFNIQEETYDLAMPAGASEDPRLRAVMEAVRSRAFRRQLGGFVGYDTSEAGEIQEIT